MTPVEIAALLIKLVVDLVGQEKASEVLSQEAITRSNAEADAIEAARGLT